MKHLLEYINERSQVNESSESKKIIFDFTDLENAEDTLKSLSDREGCEVEDTKLTVTITKDNCNKLDSVQDILQQYSEILRSSTKRSSNEQYAQKTKSFAEKVAEFNDALDEIQNSDDNNEDE